NGMAINPTARQYPRDFIQTGISVIDGMNTLIRGQKLPIFSGNGLPHNELAAQIARQAKIRGTDTEFAVVFAAMGIKHDVARFFTRSFEESGVLENVALFLSLADDPSIERLITPRTALTLAEHLAFNEDMHVLVVMTDMTNYCESLREISTIRGEIPSRKGYPGYLYSDLAELYERSGMIKGREGSITLASQLFAAYSYVKDVRNLASVIGEEELTPLDHNYLDFGRDFEQKFVSQGKDEDRTIEQTLDMGWEVLRTLPVEELHRITEEEIEKFYGQ
ncbi:MAG: V-type ATP synthase subunit B, partial [bacterium]